MPTSYVPPLKLPPVFTIRESMRTLQGRIWSKIDQHPGMGQRASPAARQQRPGRPRPPGRQRCSASQRNSARDEAAQCQSVDDPGRRSGGGADGKAGSSGVACARCSRRSTAAPGCSSACTSRLRGLAYSLGAERAGLRAQDGAAEQRRPGRCRRQGAGHRGRVCAAACGRRCGEAAASTPCRACSARRCRRRVGSDPWTSNQEGGTPWPLS